MKRVFELGIFTSTLLMFSTCISAQTHAGQVDTDGVLSPGEVRNPTIDYGNANSQPYRHSPSENDSTENCEGMSRRDIGTPRVEVRESKSSGNFFGDKVKIKGTVEGTCLSEAGLFENGRKVESIAIPTRDRFGRYDFEVKAHMNERPEIRAYNTMGERDILEVR